MLELILWSGIAAAVLGTAYALTLLFWRPECDVDRSQLGHWFRSLIRLYESDALVEVSQRGSGLRFTLLRRSGDGRHCWVVLSCPPCPGAAWTVPPLASVREAIAAEPGVLILHDMSGEDTEQLEVQIHVRDIWSNDAADVVVRVAERVLDALGVSEDARFDLDFDGEQSMERSFEARRRQREGSLQEW